MCRMAYRPQPEAAVQWRRLPSYASFLGSKKPRPHLTRRAGLRYATEQAGLQLDRGLAAPTNAAEPVAGDVEPHDPHGFFLRWKVVREALKMGVKLLHLARFLAVGFVHVQASRAVRQGLEREPLA